MSQAKAARPGQSPPALSTSQETHRSYLKMMSDPGRDASDFFPSESDQHHDKSATEASSAYQHAVQQHQQHTTSAHQHSDTAALPVHQESSIEVLGVEEYEDALAQPRSVKHVSSPALSSEQSALKAVLAELQSRSASASPV